MMLKRYFIYIICIVIVITNTNVVLAERITQSFQGIQNAQEILNNIDFLDVSSQPNDYWAKNAIYKMAGLGVIKGYGQKTYKPKDNITKVEAIALIYRAIGKETQAQQELEKFKKDTIFEVSNRDATSIWAEGYLLLAKNDGLISDIEFYQAIMSESYQKTEQNYFLPNDFAKREEVAVWIAKAFKLEPEYNQISIFNNYADWKLTNYEYIPYIEAVLKQKIMNGDNGYFHPKNVIKRDEMAQLLSNIEDSIYEVNEWKKKYGYIENIIVSDNQKINTDLVTKTIMLRADDGSLNTIILSTLNDNISSKTEEIGTHNNINYENEVIVNNDGLLGKSSRLTKYDKVLIIYDNDNNIQYIEAKSSPSYEERIYGKIDSINFKNNTIEFTDKDFKSRSYIISNAIVVSIDDIGCSLADLNIGDKANIIVRNGIVTRIEASDSIYNDNPNIDEGEDDVRGIVQEINENLRYISLYGPLGEKDSNNIKKYNFNPRVEVKKDNSIAGIKDIDIGDTVYLKINSQGNVELINVKSNNYQAYGEIITLGDEVVIIKFDNGSSKQYTISKDINIYKNGSPITKDNLLPGDRVMVTLTGDREYEKIKEINIEPDYNLINNIYKGQVYDINNNQIILFNTNILNKTKWNSEKQKGYVKILLDSKVKLYDNGQLIDINNAYSKYLNKTVYVATVSNYNNSERAIKIMSLEGNEKLYNDYVGYHNKAIKTLEFQNSSNKIVYNNGTIILKHGRLIDGNNIKNDDPLYVVGLNNPETGKFIASIIDVTKKPSIEGIDIYNAKIYSIDEGKSFIVSSFSKLNNYKWESENTPKTFEIDNNTIITTSQGIINNRDFTDSGEASYKDKIVYIAADGTKALEISDAIFGTHNMKGEIRNISSNNAAGSKIELQNVSVLGSISGTWTSRQEAIIDAYANSIIVKNSNLVDVEDLEVGDKVRIIKRDNTDEGDGFIILVED